MSRNHKDKYENSNPRRTHTFMSTEDANSGKKSYWPELEITGSIRNLSPNLWQLTHLTALYLNDNSLQRIPSEIGRLVNLRALDLSSNKLRSLPAELGDLIYLRELLLNQNYLRVLPYELGKLFQLQVLGLQGNPLSKEIMALYGEPSGTHKLLSYMLDNLQGTYMPSNTRRTDKAYTGTTPHFQKDGIYRMISRHVPVRSSDHRYLRLAFSKELFNEVCSSLPAKPSE
ncbi:CCR4-NOT transcription complex subunit 6-like isoform X1 [Bombus pascuorum]|uniref:CCR4-NOT transcription complex subunit 6-like isoform X1 n=1 Tax=Bombus pascuorum TaxID=65598 RepID=UPI00298E5626|nr:CCR4-NOT transcription complex subunit 6-like isoform X1 [Bombus pascuorum]XP_060819599.1 CCR4-NOT transcription complex subunit 6-like isoform X1 [Bombus pascuorum]